MEELTPHPKKDTPLKDNKKKTDKIPFEPVLDTIKENKVKDDLVKPTLSPKIEEIEIIEEIQQEITESVYLDNKIHNELKIILNNQIFVYFQYGNLYHF